MWLGNDACNTTRAGCAANEHTLEREEEDSCERRLLEGHRVELRSIRRNIRCLIFFFLFKKKLL